MRVRSKRLVAPNLARPPAGLTMLLILFMELTGCQRTLVPDGLAGARSLADASGIAYQIPWAERNLPDLTLAAPLDQAIEFAMKSSGEVEAAYLEWRGALERVPQAGALADPRLDFQFLFMPENFASFSGILSGALSSVRLMATQDLPASDKRKAEANRALAEAEASGERFRAARFDLQRKVTQAYTHLALNHDLAANTSETLQLLVQTREITLQHYHSIQMETAADIQKAELEIDRAASEQRGRTIAETSLRSALNGILNRPPDAPIGRVEIPAFLFTSLDAASLLGRTASRNPELAALRREVEARGAAQVLADLQTKPDYSIGGGLDDPLVPLFSASMTLPVNRERIRAGIAEALAMRQAAEARLRQGAFDAQARLMMALAGIADAERVIADTTNHLIPKAGETLRSQQAQYGNGGGSYMELLDTQRLLVDLRRMNIQARADRILYLAEVEEILGEDLLARNASAAALPEESH